MTIEQRSEIVRAHRNTRLLALAVLILFGCTVYLFFRLERVSERDPLSEPIHRLVISDEKGRPRIVLTAEDLLEPKIQLLGGGQNNVAHIELSGKLARPKILLRELYGGGRVRISVSGVGGRLAVYGGDGELAWATAR